MVAAAALGRRRRARRAASRWRARPRLERAGSTRTAGYVVHQAVVAEAAGAALFCVGHGADRDRRPQKDEWQARDRGRAPGDRRAAALRGRRRRRRSARPAVLGRPRRDRRRLLRAAGSTPRRSRTPPSRTGRAAAARPLADLSTARRQAGRLHRGRLSRGAGAPGAPPRETAGRPAGCRGRRPRRRRGFPGARAESWWEGVYWWRRSDGRGRPAERGFNSSHAGPKGDRGRFRPRAMSRTLGPRRRRRGRRRGRPRPPPQLAQPAARVGRGEDGRTTSSRTPIGRARSGSSACDPAPVSRATPSSREEGGARGGAESGSRVWIIDPLDGTSNFVSGFPFWCVSIAAREGEELVAAVVWDPLRDEMYTAERGGGAWRNGTRLSRHRPSGSRRGVRRDRLSLPQPAQDRLVPRPLQGRLRPRPRDPARRLGGARPRLRRGRRLRRLLRVSPGALGRRGGRPADRGGRGRC